MGKLNFLSGKSKKIIILFVVCALLLLCAVGGTVAYLVVRTDPLTNIFDPIHLNSIVSNSAVANLSGASEFVRSKVLISYKDIHGNILAAEPVEGVDFSITYDTENWVYGSDGFWYYKKALQAMPHDFDVSNPDSDFSTFVSTRLITECLQLKEAPDGYELEVEFLVSVIQAEPVSVVESVWHVTVTDGIITPP